MRALVRRRLDRVDAIIAALLGLGYLTLLLATTKTLGYARDEGFYFQAASSYARWFDTLRTNAHAAFDPRFIDATWSANHEHPALMKSLFALSSLVLQQRAHLFAMEGTSYRFPAMVVSSGLVALVYVWGAQARGRAAGAAAALLLALMPRFFYHAHLACFDAPIAAFWALCAYAYWNALARGGALWPLFTGVAFGLALDTKHNAWFLPILVVVHLALAQGIVWRRSRAIGLQRGVVALAAMSVVGPLVFYALWPWIWHGTVARVREYVLFHVNHEYYNMEFFGLTYWKPPMPRAYAWVMTAATVPVVTLVAFAIGAVPAVGRLARATLVRVRGARLRDALVLERHGATELLWLLAIAVSYGPWLSRTTPIFGGTKHWMTAYPFVALFAGAGFDSVVRAARAAWLRARAKLGPALAKVGRSRALEIALGAAVIAAPATETIRSHPWGLSSYTPLVGGAAGAATLGLNRTFWGYTTGAVTPYLNDAVPRSGTVYIHDTAGPSWDMLLRDGRLRRDIHGAWTVAGADFSLYHHEQHMLGQEYQAWVAYGTVRPDFVAGLDGVPVIWIYRRPGK